MKYQIEYFDLDLHSWQESAVAKSIFPHGIATEEMAKSLLADLIVLPDDKYRITEIAA